MLPRPLLKRFMRSRRFWMTGYRELMHSNADPEVQAILLEHLTSEDRLKRCLAYRELAKYSDKETLLRMLEVIETETSFLRRASIHAVHTLLEEVPRDEEIVQALKASSIPDLAASAIDHGGDTTQPQDKSPADRDSASESLESGESPGMEKEPECPSYQPSYRIETHIGSSYRIDLQKRPLSETSST